IVGGLVVAHDVTDTKSREHRLREWATRDGVTGLWNRDRFVRELGWYLSSRRRRHEAPASLLFVDLDSFKGVNDSLGHAAGDELLAAAARQIEARVRHTDAVGRLGGDEFAVLLPGATAEDARRVGEQIAGAIAGVWPAGHRGGASI